mmetsp:Transcript_68757/g.223904  ORF Transcript_68757/g.223904 Transcript_68757/m.223904 type:complete len:657 (+) Transcript_68757:64-2034(+)
MVFFLPRVSRSTSIVDEIPLTASALQEELQTFLQVTLRPTLAELRHELVDELRDLQIGRGPRRLATEAPPTWQPPLLHQHQRKDHTTDTRPSLVISVDSDPSEALPQTVSRPSSPWPEQLGSRQRCRSPASSSRERRPLGEELPPQRELSQMLPDLTYSMLRLRRHHTKRVVEGEDEDSWGMVPPTRRHREVAMEETCSLDLEEEQPFQQRSQRVGLLRASSRDGFGNPAEQAVCAPSQSRSLGPKRWSCPPLRSLALSLVSSPKWEMGVAFLIVLSSVLVGIETDLRTRHPHQPEPWCLDIFERLLAAVFTVEIVLRVCVHRSRFFSMSGWLWNVFDLTIAGTLLVVELLYVSFDVDVKFMSVLRTLRLVRITRLVRMIRLVEDLRMMLSSIVASLKHLVWTILLLVALIYCVAICITEVVSMAGEAEQSEVQLWWGTLDRSMLTLFESITGGLSWDEAVRPLHHHVSPFMAYVFCAYIAFCLFAVLNVVTGVFVNQASVQAQEDKDTYLANSISDLFFKGSGVDSSDITWDKFSHMLNTPDMQEYFEAINVDISEAEGLFALLDVDGSGSVDPQEVVDGCLRLRGQAKAIELSLLSQQTRVMFEKLALHQEWVQDTLLKAMGTNEHNGVRSSVLGDGLGGNGNEDVPQMGGEMS